RGAEHDILLGKTTCMLPGLPIVDWRNAPISRVFYRYRQGEDYEEEIAGRERTGEVAARRTVAVRERLLKRVEAPEGIFEADPAIDSRETLVVVFSPALRDYVSHVLPALAVTRVQVRTFHEWASEQCRRLFPRLPRETRAVSPAVVQRLKLHPALRAALARQVARVEGPATAAQVIDD